MTKQREFLIWWTAPNGNRIADENGTRWCIHLRRDGTFGVLRDGELINRTSTEAAAIALAERETLRDWENNRGEPQQ